MRPSAATDTPAGVAEWILGAQRSDRASTHTHFASVRAAPSSDDVLDAGEEPVEGRATVLFCTQRDRSAGFGGGTAFFALAGDSEEPADWTCDRRELFDARGRAVVADHYAQASGCGLVSGVKRNTGTGTAIGTADRAGRRECDKRAPGSRLQAPGGVWHQA